MKNPVTTLALISVLGISAPASGQPLGDADLGREFALKTCAECHSVLPGGGASPNPDAPTFSAIAHSPGMSRIALVSWFQTPHKKMPNLMLENADKDNLIAYITGLREMDQ